MELQPNDAFILHDWGIYLQLTGRVDEAVAAFGRALSLNPTIAVRACVRVCARACVCAGAWSTVLGVALLGGPGRGGERTGMGLVGVKHCKSH